MYTIGFLSGRLAARRGPSMHVNAYGIVWLDSDGEITC